MDVPTLTAIGVELWSGEPLGTSGVVQAIALPAGQYPAALPAGQYPAAMSAAEWHRRAMLARWLVACSNACRGVSLDVIERVADRRERKPDLADSLTALLEAVGAKE